MHRSKAEIIEIFDELEANHGITREDIAQDVEISRNYLYQVLGKDNTQDLNPRIAFKFNAYIDKHLHLLPQKPPPMPPTEKVQLLDLNGKLIPLDDSATTNVLPDYEKLIVDYFKGRKQASHIYRIEDLTMHSIFFPGDLLLLVEADRAIIISGELFVIEFNNGKTVVRYVQYNEKDPSLYDLKTYKSSMGTTPGVPPAAIKRMFKIVHLSRKMESPVNNSVVPFQK